MDEPQRSGTAPQRHFEYPSVSLRSALELAARLAGAVGPGEILSREAIARHLGYGSLNGASVRAVAALSHYGLMQRHSKGYVRSGLLETLLNAPAPEVVQEALVRVFRSSPLFRELHDRFGGCLLPGEFAELLERDYGHLKSPSAIC